MIRGQARMGARVTSAERVRSSESEGNLAYIWIEGCEGLSCKY